MIVLSKHQIPNDNPNPYRIVVNGTITGESLSKTEEFVFEKIRHYDGTSIVIDMKNVRYIDSRGISLCIRIFKECKDLNIAFKLETNPEVFRLFAVANLVEAMNIALVKES